MVITHTLALTASIFLLYATDASHFHILYWFFLLSPFTLWLLAQPPAWVGAVQRLGLCKRGFILQCPQSYTESILPKVPMSNSRTLCLHRGTLPAPFTDPDLQLPQEGKVKIEQDASEHSVKVSVTVLRALQVIWMVIWRLWSHLYVSS